MTAIPTYPSPLSILVPLDGSDWAKMAYEAAYRLRPGRLTLLQVIPQTDRLAAAKIPQDVDNLVDEVRATLETMAEPLRKDGLDVDVRVRIGDPATVIVDEGRAYDLIAMTTRGRGAAGRTMFGSVADRVSRASDVPTALIRANGVSGLVVPTRIVVPLDGSGAANAALPIAARLSGMIECPMVLVRAVDFDDVRTTIREQRQAGRADESYDTARSYTAGKVRHFLEDQQAMLAANGYDSDIMVLDGTPSFALLDEVRESDLVVMSTHGKTGFRRWLLGSVSEKLVRESRAPVVLVPTRAAGAAFPDDVLNTRGEDVSMADETPETGERAILDLLHKEQYTPEEIAHLFGMDVSVIHQAAHRHELPAVFIGNDVATITRADLVRWMEHRRRG